MNISKSRKFFKGFAAAAMSAAMLCGCGANGGEEKMPPDDTPWNHGTFAIMETENGYYSNDSQTLCLRYYEKSTGAEIFLCAKPECRHNGNDYCTATYRYLETTNTLMYDGAIYFLAVENDGDTVGFSLYRTAADGSSIDRVGEVFKAKNPAEKEYSTQSDGFIIHRGYAYIPYFLAVGSGTVNSFAGSGLVKMNIRTGACEQLFSGKGYFSSYPQNLKGCGDYVYFDMWGDDAENGYDHYGTYRYNTVNGSISPVVEKDEFACAAAVTEDILYYTEPSENYTLNISMYDAESLEYLGLAAETDVKNFAAEIIAYDGMLFVPDNNNVRIYRDGEVIGSIGYSEVEYKYADKIYTFQYNMGFSFKISDGKLYCNNMANEYIPEEWVEYGTGHYVLSCPIEDIIAGNGVWKKEYAVKRSLFLCEDVEEYYWR